MTKSPWVRLVLGGLFPGVVLVGLLSLLVPAFDLLAPWIAGGAAIGLLSGFVTGASEAQGSGAEFLRFLSGAVVLPLFGALPALLDGPQRTTEQSVYTDQLLTEKVVETGLTDAAGYIAPLYVIGAFLVAYGIMAVIGILIGNDARKDGQVVIKYHQ